MVLYLAVGCLGSWLCMVAAMFLERHTRVLSRIGEWVGRHTIPILCLHLLGYSVIGAAMAFELAAYGIIVGLLYSRSRWQCVISLYRSLLAAMVGGRLVWAAARVVMTGVAQVPFTWEIFLADAFLSAIPGIILQLVFIPVLMVALDRTGLVHFRKEARMPAQG